MHFFRAFYCFVLGLNILYSTLIPGLQRHFISIAIAIIVIITTTTTTVLVVVVVVFVVLKGTTLIRRPSLFSELEL
jgi:tryptophan-rich sensory protein